MLFTSFGQVVVLVLLFFGGLCLGLGLHPGGKKWRKRLYAESEAYSAYRRKAEAKISEGSARIAELERDNASLRGQPEVAPPVAVPDPPSPALASAEPGAEPVVEPDLPAEGNPDDLSRLRGVDEPLREKLAGLGVTRFADIEQMSAEDEMALEQRLGIPAGLITSEQWRDQAALLRAGKTEEHGARFGAA
ncbi:hypothetical protein [Sphingomonas sp. ERG5]|uniref:hypothetical protein n=1 Tax=Sphingomonas sp. ERG5 TaxID=1381597 RepID=UPI00068DCC81|nr:hypothetical protein [Sphingomonas sp. ERG5]